MLKAKKYYSQYADKEGWIDSEIEPHYFDAKIEIQYMAPIPPYYFRKVLHVDEVDFSMGVSVSGASLPKGKLYA